MNVKKKALGRGLSALLDPVSNELITTDSEGKEMAWSHANIPLSRIFSSPFQPRTDFEESSLQELAQSLKEQGIIQPITVRRTGYEKYQLIAGERRFRAAQIAGLTHIPAFIRSVDDNQMLEMALVENIQRKDLNSIEIAISFQRLVDECQLTQENLAEKVGKNRATIANYLRLLKLPPEIQISLRDDKITMGHARAIINLEDKEKQLALLNQILAKGLSVRDVEKKVRQFFQDKPKHPTRKKEVPARLAEFTKQLEGRFGGKVELKRNKNGKGTLSMSFRNDEELELIIKSMTP